MQKFLDANSFVWTKIKNLLILVNFKIFASKQTFIYHLFVYSRAKAFHDADAIVATSTSYTTCSPKTQIMFLKTHKCGSSTLQVTFIKGVPLGGTNVGSK